MNSPIVPPSVPQIEERLLAFLILPLVAYSALAVAAVGTLFHVQAIRQWRLTRRPSGQTRVLDGNEYTSIRATERVISSALFDQPGTEEDEEEDGQVAEANDRETCATLNSADPTKSIFGNYASQLSWPRRITPVVLLAALVALKAVKLFAIQPESTDSNALWETQSVWIASFAILFFSAFASYFVRDLSGPTANVTSSVVASIHLFVLIFDPANAGQNALLNNSTLVILSTLIASNVQKAGMELKQKVAVLNKQKMETRTTLEIHSNYWGFLMFSWITPLVKLASTRAIKGSDIWRLRDCDVTSSILRRYKACKNVHDDHYGFDTVAGLGKRGRGIYWSLARTIGGYAFVQILISSATVITQFSGPFFINLLLKSFESLPSNPTPVMLLTPLLYILCQFLSNSVSAILLGQQFFVGRRCSSQARSVLIAEIYAKSLRRVAWTGQSHTSNDAVEDASESNDQNTASTGKIITLLSADVEKIREYLSYTYNLLLYFPVSLTISVVSLVNVMGLIPTICGLSVMTFMGPLNYMAGKWLKQAQERLSKATDKRVNATNELLHGIRILKYLAWEDKFSENVGKLRDAELAQLYNLSIKQLFFNTTSTASGLLVSFIIFSVHTLTSPDYKMDPATAFTALYLVQQFMDILSRLPYDLMFFFQAKVAMERVAKFLDEEEVDAPSATDETNETPRIGFENATFAFYGCNNILNMDGETTTNHFMLRDLNLDFKIGGLNVICGSTGSGKTTLCLALLGELNRISGRTFLHDGTTQCPKIAYAAQTAWLLNATVRENILMGAAFDTDRYHQVLNASALLKDLETFEGGDLTEIGEKGVNVSGGQKQRISIARALYSDASIVILDDPLSAVDAPTARHLMTHAVCGSLLADRTVILVTHAISLVLPVADHVIFLKRGQVVACGTALEVAQNAAVRDVTETMLAVESPRPQNMTVQPSKAKIDAVLKRSSADVLVQSERMASGTVSHHVYWAYLKAAGGAAFGLLFLASFWVTIFVQFGNDFWLKRWSEFGNQATLSYSSENNADNYLVSSLSPWSHPIVGSFVDVKLAKNASHAPTGPKNGFWEVMYFIGIYGCFGIGIILSQNFNSIITVVCAQKASRKIHNDLIKAMLGAPLRFFEVTPIGRILNRFSKDVNTIDQGVMNAIRFFVSRVFVAIMVVGVIATGSAYFIVAALPIVWVSLSVGKMYLNASRELKRLESVSRSPIYSQFSETLTGVATIRAYRQSDRFLHQNNQKVDNNHRFFYTLWACNRWLCVRTDLISAAVVLLSGITVLLAQSYVSKGWSGIILLYAGKFSDALVWLVRMHAEMEMALDSVERCVEYSQVEQEPPRVNTAYRPESNWPQQGLVEVKNLSIRYAPDQPRVLKQLEFTVKPGEKIGVVGRTGAGKSTLSLAFFRIVPFDEGTISIDGMDIAQMGLHDLRSRLTIIPQDPVLFEGTIRSNLDPFSEYSDADLWQVLKATHVLESLENGNHKAADSNALHDGDSIYDERTESIREDAPFLEGNSGAPRNTHSNSTGSGHLNLESPVTENGHNFSQGQRQLLCMARALLRNTRVVFLDEATASIDGPTDARIQTTIRERLWDKTIFAIAHRLKSVADYDRILVLDGGKIVEYASPYELIVGHSLRDEASDDRESLITGQFRAMCAETGEFDEIYGIAQVAWESKRG
ncbi:hypothetical protein BJ741DRAFT_600512 [Chytriomyces cf. hyalinus JEL632]|nr:hypothetical protein BJ741DRAFT_600512 [Chytriomyces cf. hyalinus JEL632]